MIRTLPGLGFELVTARSAPELYDRAVDLTIKITKVAREHGTGSDDATDMLNAAMGMLATAVDKGAIPIHFILSTIVDLASLARDRMTDETRRAMLVAGVATSIAEAGVDPATTRALASTVIKLDRHDWIAIAHTAQHCVLRTCAVACASCEARVLRAGGAAAAAGKPGLPC